MHKTTGTEILVSTVQCTYYIKHSGVELLRQYYEISS